MLTYDGIVGVLEDYGVTCFQHGIARAILRLAEDDQPGYRPWVGLVIPQPPPVVLRGEETVQVRRPKRHDAARIRQLEARPDTDAPDSDRWTK